MSKQRTAIVFCAGGGGVEAGFKDASVLTVAAVDHDPKNEGVSLEIAKVHQENFPECRLHRETIQNISDLNFEGIPAEPDFLWASPPCTEYSTTNPFGKEGESDIGIAEAIADGIAQLRPRYFLLENVKEYTKGKAFAIIIKELERQKYRYIYRTVNMANYGVPQARRRLILQACRHHDDINSLNLPPEELHVGWYEAIRDLIPALPDAKLLPKQQESVDKWLERHAKDGYSQPLIIDRIGGWGDYTAIPGNQPALTVLRSHFIDHRNNSRNHFANIWLPDGTVKRVSIECVRRLQAFPDWYKLPEKTAIAGAILGMAVPPMFVTKLVKAMTQNNSLTVMTSSNSNEAYTPDEIISAVLDVFGDRIDLDPCSNSHENPNIPAHTIYTAADDGLSHKWYGRVYCNPPYSETAKWVDKAVQEYDELRANEIILLLKSATGTRWFQQIDRFPKCFLNGRLTFKEPKEDGTYALSPSPAPFDSTVFYLGDHPEKFESVFRQLGRVHDVLEFSTSQYNMRRLLRNYKAYLEAGLPPFGSVEYLLSAIQDLSPEEFEQVARAIESANTLKAYVKAYAAQQI
jgi:phage N-6-adenine-methyltransferase